MYRHPALLVRALDHHLGDAGLLARGEDMLAHLQILVKQPRIFASGRIPARIPSAVDAAPEPDRIDLLSHQAGSSTWRTITVIRANGFSMRLARPRALAFKSFINNPLPTKASDTISASTSRSWLFSALAIADSSVFFTSPAMRLREKVRSASALSTFLPRISWASRFSFCGLTRRSLVTALASLSASVRSRAALPITL